MHQQATRVWEKSNIRKRKTHTLADDAQGLTEQNCREKIPLQDIEQRLVPTLRNKNGDNLLRHWLNKNEPHTLAREPHTLARDLERGGVATMWTASAARLGR